MLHFVCLYVRCCVRLFACVSVTVSEREPGHGTRNCSKRGSVRFFSVSLSFLVGRMMH